MEDWAARVLWKSDRGDEEAGGKGGAAKTEVNKGNSWNSRMIELLENSECGIDYGLGGRGKQDIRVIFQS